MRTDSMTGYYDYDKLVKRALNYNASQEDINALGEWFENHGTMYWNGEYFEIDTEHRLFPVYKEINEDEPILIGYEIR